MPAPIQPAVLSLAPDGTPYSPVFDDVYHTSAGGLGQAGRTEQARGSRPSKQFHLVSSLVPPKR